MLTIWGVKQGRFCDGMRRRDFLQIGSLGMAGMLLPDLLRLRAQCEAQRSHKAVIIVSLSGGPPHLDMWDMKPAAPVEICGEFRPMQTRAFRFANASLG